MSQQFSDTVQPIERQMGIELYSTDISGFGGRTKTTPYDFIVEEITPEGTVLNVSDVEQRDQTATVAGARSRYVRFTAQKIGMTTVELASLIASHLGIPTYMVTYAGLKDKRAVTTQAMSVPSGNETGLLGFRSPRAILRDFAYARRPIQVGDLWGNHFRITIRFSEPQPDEIARAATTVLETPLLNYFGEQRFGVARPYTHLVGRALVRRDPEEAIRLLLTTCSEHEPPELTEVRMKLASNMVPTEYMLNVFTKGMWYERAVLKHLIRRTGDFRGAVKKIPPRVLTLFVHAYQSYLFNRLISERARQGMSIVEPEPGDFLIRLDQTHSGRDSWSFVTERGQDQARELVVSGQCVLAAPVPGYSTKTPPSRQTEVLLRVLSKEDIGLTSFRNPSIRALDSPGGLHPVSMRAICPSVSVEECGLKLSFALRKGSYATVVLREIMRNHPINRS
ncbi:MAG: tRNA pseudouridine(13) synthase TruD [Candidatus Thorarchaeota archaeon]